MPFCTAGACTGELIPKPDGSLVCSVCGEVYKPMPTGVVCPICGSIYVLAPCGYEHCSNPGCPGSYEKGRGHCERHHK